MRGPVRNALTVTLVIGFLVLCGVVIAAVLRSEPDWRPQTAIVGVALLLFFVALFVTPVLVGLRLVRRGATKRADNEVDGLPVLLFPRIAGFRPPRAGVLVTEEAGVRILIKNRSDVLLAWEDLAHPKVARKLAYGHRFDVVFLSTPTRQYIVQLFRRPSAQMEPDDVRQWAETIGSRIDVLSEGPND